jgi:hypothetical protein
LRSSGAVADIALPWTWSSFATLCEEPAEAVPGDESGVPTVRICDVVIAAPAMSAESVAATLTGVIIEPQYW